MNTQARPGLVENALEQVHMRPRERYRARWRLRREWWSRASRFALLLVALIALAAITHADPSQHSSARGTTSPSLAVSSAESGGPSGSLNQGGAVRPSLGSGAGSSSSPLATPAATPTPDWGPALPLPSDPTTLNVGPFPISLDQVKWVLQAILGFVQWIVQAIVGGIMALIGPFFDPISPYYLLSTPHLLTDQNAGVLGFIHGGTGWAALAALAVIVLLGGYNIMVRLHLGLPYHTLMEFVPRLALGAVGSVVIVAVIGGLIDLVNGLDQIGIAQIQTTFQWPDLVNNPTVFGLIYLLFTLCYVIFLLLVSIQLLVRLALIDLCLVLSPIALVCWILPQTQRWTQFWLNTLLGALFTQPLQVLAIALGTTLFTTFGVQTSVWGMLLQLGIGIASFWLAWRMPRLMESWAVRFSMGSVGSPFDLFAGAGRGGGGDIFVNAGSGGGGGDGAGGDAAAGGLGGDAGAAAGAGEAAGTIVDGEVVSSTIIGGDLVEALPLLLLA